MTLKQCSTCPWRVEADPYDIPNGYCVKKHEALDKTIRSGVASIGGPLQIMACHYSPVGEERPCAGWVANQLGPGNNLGLRLAVMRGRIDGDFELLGEQHEHFEDTLP